MTGSSPFTKDSIDIGLVTNDAERLIAFYRDVVGLEDLGDWPYPAATMHKLRCGSAVLKIIQPNRTVSVESPTGGIHKAMGYRYMTFAVDDLERMVDACSAAGAKTAVPISSARPGVSIAIVEDPDGNWVEFSHGG